LFLQLLLRPCKSTGLPRQVPSFSPRLFWQLQHPASMHRLCFAYKVLHAESLAEIQSPRMVMYGRAIKRFNSLAEIRVVLRNTKTGKEFNEHKYRAGISSEPEMEQGAKPELEQSCRWAAVSLGRE
jgi:hypothetical protein